MGDLENPYVRDGEPHLVDSVVVFLDLLGTKGSRTDEEALAQLRATKDAVSSAAHSLLGQGKSVGSAGASRWFSDNLGLSYAIHGPWDGTYHNAFLVRHQDFLGVYGIKVEPLLVQIAQPVGSFKPFGYDTPPPPEEDP